VKAKISLVALTCAGMLAGCAATLPPPERINASQAYRDAGVGQAAPLVPGEMHKAQAGHATTEQSFRDDPQSFRTPDLTDVSDRKAKRTEARATTAAGSAATAKANKDGHKTQAEIAKNAKEALAASERSAALTTAKPATERKATVDAEENTADTQADFSKLATVREEPRGAVITLSGRILFAPDQSTILPRAQDQLSRVADALLALRDRSLTVDSYTDAQDSSNHSQGLSLERAYVVRLYLISRGYSGDLIQVQGFGEENPIAGIASVQGRANNRRIEIVIGRVAK